MKPDYLQSKVEELLRHKDHMISIATEAKMQTAVLESNIKTLHDEITALKNRPMKDKISQQEKDVLIRVIMEETMKLNRQELNQHKKTLAKTSGLVARNEIESHLDKMTKYLDIHLKFIEKGARMTIVASNHNGMLIDRIIDVIDPDGKTFNKGENAMMVKRNKTMVRGVF